MSFASTDCILTHQISAVLKSIVELRLSRGIYSGYLAVTCELLDSCWVVQAFERAGDGGDYRNHGCFRAYSAVSREDLYFSSRLTKSFANLE
jgi:hypothetical protein